MRPYATFCFLTAAFYAFTAVQAHHSGTVTPMSGNTSVLHRRDDPESRFGRMVFARWLISGGFASAGLLFHFLAGKFEKLEAVKRKE